MTTPNKDDEDKKNLTEDGGEMRLSQEVAAVVAAYVARNDVTREELPKLIAEIRRALQNQPEPQHPVTKPIVPIRQSVTHDHIVCLICGKKYRSLRRHLIVDHETTPEQYRQKFHLPYDYPMVAQSYAKKRSQLAKAMGLGKMRVGKKRRKGAGK